MSDQLRLDFESPVRAKRTRAKVDQVLSDQAGTDTGDGEESLADQRLFPHAPNVDVHLRNAVEAVADIHDDIPELTVVWLRDVVGTVEMLKSRQVTFPVRALDRLLWARSPAQVTLDATCQAIAKAIWADKLGHRPLEVRRNGRRLVAASPNRAWPTALRVIDAPWPAIAAIERMGLPLDIDERAHELMTSKLALTGRKVAKAGLAGSAVLLTSSHPHLLEQLHLPGLAYAGGRDSGRYKLPLLLAAPLLDMADRIDVPDEVARAIRKANAKITALKPSGDGFPWTLYDFQARDAGRAKRILETTGGVLLAGDMGSGKSLDRNLRVLTPTGWTTAGEVRVGDELVGRDGRQARVLGVYPQGVQPIFRVTFTDGTTADCTDDHLWLVTTPVRKSRGRPYQVKPLSELRADLTEKPAPGRARGNWRWHVPICEPVEYAPLPEPLPIDPYLLGVLLGDGCISGPAIRVASADPQVIEEVRWRLPGAADIHHRDRVTYAITSPPGQRNPVSSALRELGLLGHRAWEKFIPEDYLRASINERVELLQGLMDTEGTVERSRSPRGSYRSSSITYTSTSEQLADDVAELVRSLGGTARMSSRFPTYTHDGEKKTGREAWLVTMSLPGELVPFKLDRKRDLYQPRVKYPPTKAIVSVEPIGEDEAVCFKVDSPDETFLVDDFTVTHNTTVALGLAHEMDIWPLLVVCPLAAMSTWVRQLTEMGKSFYLATDSPDISREKLFEEQWDAVIISYDRIHDFTDEVTAFGFRGICADEIQRIKTPSSRRSRAMRALSSAVEYRLGLSGTPISGKVEHALPVGAFLIPSEWKPRTTVGQLVDLYPDDDPVDGLTAHLQSMMVRRRIDQVGVPLPERTDRRVKVKPSRDQIRALKALEEEAKAAKEAGGLGTHMHVFARLQRMRQIVNCPSMAGIYSGNPKVLSAVELAEQFDVAGRKTVIFVAERAAFRELGAELDRHGLGWVGIWGSSSPKERFEAERRFHEDDDVRVFIGTIASCAESLTLSPTATAVVFCSYSYNASDLEQAEARAYRLNSLHPTEIIYLHLDLPGGGLDDRFVEILTVKKALFSRVVDLQEFSDPVETAPSMDDLIYLLTGEKPERSSATAKRKRLEQVEKLSFDELSKLSADEDVLGLSDLELEAGEYDDD